MTPIEFLQILRLVGQAAPEIMSLIKRLQDGEDIPIMDAELEAGRKLVRGAVEQWDNTPPGQRT